MEAVETTPVYERTFDLLDLTLEQMQSLRNVLGKQAEIDAPGTFEIFNQISNILEGRS